MADTDIEWAHKVWNVTRGCRRVSSGCENCYAERQAARFSGPGQPYEGLVRVGPNGPRWTGRGRFVAEKLSEPLNWRASLGGSRLRIFVDSMSDLFYEEFSNEQIAAVFGVMAACPQHDFLILTKRPARMMEWFRWLADYTERDTKASTDPDVTDGTAEYAVGTCRIHTATFLQFDQQAAWIDLIETEPRWPLRNVWLGVSVEDQETADERIPLLLQTPAAVRWVSAEPLLGPADLSSYLYRGVPDAKPGDSDYDALQWIVVGGESGPGARPFDINWARKILEDCQVAQVPVFVKQLGRHVVSEDRPGWRAGLKDRKGGDITEWDEWLRVREFPEVTRACISRSTRVS